MQDAIFLKVSAAVRYWEDAELNGKDVSESGDEFPLREAGLWAPFIRLEDGHVEDWPEGTTAFVHFKVCDQGVYFLANERKQIIADWKGYYVPDAFLGFGDYIIMRIDEKGFIKDYQKPAIDLDEWNVIPF